jgi:hypothetical protein
VVLRLPAVKTDLGSRVVRAWSIVPAAVSEREVAVDLLCAGPAPRDLLADKGFSGRAFAAAQAARGTAVLVPPDKKQRAVTRAPSLLRTPLWWPLLGLGGSRGDGLVRSPENGQHDTTAPGFCGDTDWQQGDAPQSAG